MHQGPKYVDAGLSPQVRRQCERAWTPVHDTVFQMPAPAHACMHKIKKVFGRPDVQIDLGDETVV
jgi:hypothetical protein